MKSALGITFGFLFHATLVIDAFSVPPYLSSICHSVRVPPDDFVAGIVPTTNSELRQSTCLPLSKRRGVETTTKEQKGLDYGKILITFVNPANPYSWFLYMLGFIIVYGTINGT